MEWKARLVSHKSAQRIVVYFERNLDLIERIKSIAGARWSQSLCAWHVPDTEENRYRFNILVDPPKIPTVDNLEQLQKFKSWLLSKRYSKNTVKTYTEALGNFLYFFRD